MPFARVPEALRFFIGVAVRMETVRRLIEAAGQTPAAVADADVARRAADLPRPGGPHQQGGEVISPAGPGRPRRPRAVRVVIVAACACCTRLSATTSSRGA